MTTILYQSKKMGRNLWSDYRVEEDVVVLRWKFGHFRIPLDEIVWIDTFKPPVIRTAFWALKIDNADLFVHVGLKRKTGFFKQIRFTPDDPEAFVEAVRRAIEAKR